MACGQVEDGRPQEHWTPACAGVTSRGDGLDAGFSGPQWAFDGKTNNHPIQQQQPCPL